MKTIDEMAREYVRLLGIKGDTSLDYITRIKEDYGRDFAEQVTALAIKQILNER